MRRASHYAMLGGLPIVSAALALTLLAAPVAIAEEPEANGGENKVEATVGLQDVDVDGDNGREARFERYREEPSGVVLDRLHWTYANEDTWLQMTIVDATQLDERYLLEAGIGKRIRIRAGYDSLPFNIADNATFLLGEGMSDSYGKAFRIGDLVQLAQEDPDGDGNEFFLDPLNAMTAPPDNALVETQTNDLLSGARDISLGTRRRAVTAGTTISAWDRWTFDFDVIDETREGTQPLGTGTYQRVTDLSGDGTADYDYFFSVRGLELPGVVDYRHTRAKASARLQEKTWFVAFGAEFSDFDNENLGITYDNPFWLTDTDATSGSRRGLWEEGRVSLEPSNEAWHAFLQGGFDLGMKSRISGSLSFGEHTQDVPFLPITTNTALIGLAGANNDVNRDGITGSPLDDPTLSPGALMGVPSRINGNRSIGSNLGGSSDTMTGTITFTSRPTDRLDIVARYRVYDYEGQEGIQVIPSRAEYVESHLEIDFKGGEDLLHVPNDFKRETAEVEVGYKVLDQLKLTGFYNVKSYDYEQYRDTDGNGQRDLGTRAVEGTDDDTFGLRARFKAGMWLSGRASFAVSEREYEGDYMRAFSGEQPTLRQYDIANRDRDAYDLYLDFMPSDRVTFGVNYGYYEDDYDESDFGLRESEWTMYGANLNVMVNEAWNVYAFADMSEWEADYHLRTKCSNCSGFSSWTVPDYDWFVDYTDEGATIGAGFLYDSGERITVDFNVSFLDSEVEQSTFNTDLPIDQSGGDLDGEIATVAVGNDFPDQENSLLIADLTVKRVFTDKILGGVRWIYESFQLDDFQTDDLEPYGANFLTVDDATRYLFLDARYEDYTANIFQVFVTFNL